MHRHLLWHGLDLLEGYLGSVVTQFCLSPSSDPSDPTASLLGLILGSLAIFQHAFNVIICLETFIVAVVQ